MTTTMHLWQQAESHLTASDTVIAALIDKYGPCTIAPCSDYFAVLCKSIVSQQLATKAAAAIFGRFTAYYGGIPTPEDVSDTTADKLRELGLSGQKITYIHDLAEKIRDGHIIPDNFPELPDAEIIRQLVSVKGIGVWTAQMFLIFALNRPDILPTDDFGVRKAIMLRYSLDAMPHKAEMETVALPWRPWRSIASWYLWRSLENAPK